MNIGRECQKVCACLVRIIGNNSQSVLLCVKMAKVVMNDIKADMNVIKSKRQHHFHYQIFSSTHLLQSQQD